ncbi:hypothetical protein ONS95_001532 [Cadophora gregata]|uniref:uncharacterized protein n=1 Tax=Cadophora gregata TaxID=51156 RepID=UPI0026DB6488|nr:uncharacterized protein ONS95_001532 [Cadophora gregata]KAK0111155.1 hypothetical protein ONS95_001532 [Cadophora gregata]KAK0112379.1 hypothetical protein ONS96_001622 [Cadophora gregata f. sp. sojae]
MILPRTTLFHTPSTSPQSETQPQDQTPSSSPDSWSLPASYRVAIFLNASILIFILAIILGLILYIRNRRPTSHQLRKSHKALSHRSQKEEEEETLLESKDAYSDSDSISRSSGGERGVGAGAGEMTEKKRPRPIHIPLPGPGTFSPVGILSPSIRTPGEKRKRGHVRWTPSVQGGEVFGILEGDGAGAGKAKEKEKEKVEKKCKCRGKRHPGCWRFDLHFEDGARPVLGEEREEGLGRLSR